MLAKKKRLAGHPVLPPILLLGGNGQLGLALRQLLGEGALLLPEQAEAGFLHPLRLAALVARLRPKVIINAAAYTQVDLAEHKPELAYQINGEACAVLAEAAQSAESLLVHFSTDYVFDGSGSGFWRERDLPAPVNVYGSSKWRGELAIAACCERHLILRTSWLHSPWRHNFVKTMLQLGAERDLLSVICDQIGAPTSAQMLAEVMLTAISQTLVKPELAGLYHVAASGVTSWYDYADFIFHEARQLGFELKIQSLRPVLSKDYPTAARRPLNSRLDTTQFRSTFGVELPHWQVGVTETLRQLAKELR